MLAYMKAEELRDGGQYSNNRLNNNPGHTSPDCQISSIAWWEGDVLIQLPSAYLPP